MKFSVKLAHRNTLRVQNLKAYFLELGVRRSLFSQISHESSENAVACAFACASWSDKGCSKANIEDVKHLNDLANEFWNLLQTRLLDFLLKSNL